MKHWVLGGDYPAQYRETETSVIFSNSLISRVVEKKGCRTISYQNLQKDVDIISAPYDDFEIRLGSGVHLSSSAFAFSGAEETACMERVPFKRTATMTSTFLYPPAGKAVLLHYCSEAYQISVTVRYEIYAGMPVMMKMLTVHNSGGSALCIDNLAVDVMKLTEDHTMLFVDSDYDSTTDFLGLDLNIYAKHYARFRYGTLEVAPMQRMNVALEPGASVDSIVAYELLFGADYYENRLIEVKEMYRRIAPWCSDNVSFFHLISNSPRTIRKAVDQCSELGIEMIIQSFGSGVNMESGRQAYLSRIKKAYDYGHSKGVRMGAYTLAYVKNYRPVKGDEALNHDGSHICRCLATDWSKAYMQKVLRFIDSTGADAVEIDGPYGMLMCAGGKTHNHDDFTDSQYKQWKASVVDWYKELKKRGVYINAPDWHFLNGINRSGVGYEEIAFSEHRSEQLVTSRIYYYKGTFSKNPSQGWGFLPLNVYHGGGKDAMFFPTEQNAFAFDWAMAQIVASGVWPTIRGRIVYDSQKGKDIFIKWLQIFKKYRAVLNGITIHFMPPRIDTADPMHTTCMDAIMSQLPYGDERGFVMFFNQTNEACTQEITLPVYYTGLTGLTAPPAPFENTKNSDVRYPVYGEEIAPLVIKARDGSSRTYVTDTKVIDKEIPPLPMGNPTENTIMIAENGENGQVYPIDSNGNVKLNVTLPAMSYKWYVLGENKA